MKNKIINYKGYEILHRHEFGRIYFSAWKGQNKINNKEIKTDNISINWNNPLNKEELEWLIN